MAQEPLFDGLTLDQGRAKRDEALERVAANTNADWRVRALEMVFELAKYQRELVADDLWRYLEKPREPRALGPIMRAAQRAGWIAPTDRYVPNPNRHLTPSRVWSSRLYVEAAG